mmetsp:Transcript_93955/g.196008  ORF Transcript_93955/g.196008 Transcript_93955/m.196008 type:complete len:326 (+) Transcript_93955:763-1740(+)
MGERNGFVGHVDVGDGRQDSPALRSLDANQIVIFGLVPEGGLETLFFDFLGDPTPVVSRGGSASDKVELVLGHFGDGEICLDATPHVTESSISCGSDFAAVVHARGAEPIRSLRRVWALEVELAEVGLVEHGSALASIFALVPYILDVLSPTEGKFSLDELVVNVLIVRRDRLSIQTGNLSFIGPVEVVLLNLGVGPWDKPAGALEGLSCLVDAALFQQNIVKTRLADSSAREWFVMGEDNSVSLCVGLVRPVLDPTRVARRFRMEARHVHVEHIDPRTSLHYPLGHFSPDTASEHHAHGVKATAVEKSIQVDIRPDKRLMIWGE